MLTARPSDRREALVAATKDLQAAESWLADMDAVASHTAGQLAAVGALAGLTRRGREQRRLLQDRLASDVERAAAAKDNFKGLAGRTSRFRGEQDVFDRFEAAEGWRRDDISRLRDRLDHHWAAVVAACVQADDPLAYGVDKLRHARATTVGDLRHLDAAAPVDRAAEHDDAHCRLADAYRARQQAEKALGSARAAFDESGRRRWGRKDEQEAAPAKAGVVFAEQRLERAAGVEGKLRERFVSLARHQQERQQTLTAADTGRKQLEAALAQFDAALDHTRAGRVRALAEDPPAHLVERLGPVPTSPAGRAVWCHHALGIEAVLDRSDGLGAPPSGRSPVMGRAHQEVAIADKLLHASVDLADPAGWADLAGQAAALRNEAERLLRARATTDWLLAPGQQLQTSRGMGDGGSTRARAKPVAGTGTEKGPGPWHRGDRASRRTRSEHTLTSSPGSVPSSGGWEPSNSRIARKITWLVRSPRRRQTASSSPLYASLAAATCHRAGATRSRATVRTTRRSEVVLS